MLDFLRVARILKNSLRKSCLRDLFPCSYYSLTTPVSGLVSSNTLLLLNLKFSRLLISPRLCLDWFIACISGLSKNLLLGNTRSCWLVHFPFQIKVVMKHCDPERAIKRPSSSLLPPRRTVIWARTNSISSIISLIY